MNTAGIMMSLDPSPLMEKGGTWVVLYCLTLSGREGGGPLRAYFTISQRPQNGVQYTIIIYVRTVKDFYKENFI